MPLTAHCSYCCYTVGTRATMSLKLAANISCMFQEAGSLEARFAAAREAGFSAVECTFPYEVDVATLAAAREAANVQHVLINDWPGDASKGERGLAALPTKLQEFRDGLEKSIEYAKALQCPNIHIMSGNKPAMYHDAAMPDTYLDNLNYAADRLKQEGLVGLIEAVNSSVTMPNYFMDSPEEAVNYLQKVNKPSLKLQLDIFHLQLTKGNLTANIKKYLPFAGHVQVAQAPSHGELDSAGEINYQYILSLLEELGYKGWIGLEYFPSGRTVDSLKWKHAWGY